MYFFLLTKDSFSTQDPYFVHLVFLEPNKNHVVFKRQLIEIVGQSDHI